MANKTRGSIRKEQYTYKGELKQTRKWYAHLTSFDGVHHCIPCVQDRGTAEIIRQIIEQLDIMNESRVEPDSVLLSRIQALPEKVQQQLVKHGFVKDAIPGVAKTLSEEILEWGKYLLSIQASQKYVKQAPNRVKRIMEGCGIVDIGKARRRVIQNWLHEFMANGSSSETTLSYIRSIKAFYTWLLEEGKITSNPLLHLKGSIRTPSKKKKIRRVLAALEQQLLLSTTEKSDVFRSMTGKSRSILYDVALLTGLRWSELYSLTIGSFNLMTTPATVTVLAAHSKRRREDVLPIRSDLVQRLSAYFKGRNTDEKAFSGMLRDKGAKMLRHDLEAAGIPFKNELGEVDFHSLRHTFVTNLVRSGVHPKITQALARHSSAELTLGRYTHVELEELAAALG